MQCDPNQIREVVESVITEKLNILAVFMAIQTVLIVLMIAAPDKNIRKIKDHLGIK